MRGLRLFAFTLSLLPWLACAATLPSPTSLPITAEITGTGTTDLVLVPGLSGGDVSWQETAVRLSDRYRVHRLRIAGLEGPVGDAPAPSSIGAVAEALTSYIQRNSSRPVMLVGHSAGGVAVLMATLQKPDLVARVIIVDALPFMSANRGSTSVDEELRGKVGAEVRDMRAEDAAAFEKRMRAQASSAVGNPDTAARIAQGGARSHRDTYAALYESLSTTDLRAEVASLRPPLTVIFADQSPLGAPAGYMARRYREQYASSRATLVEITDARHYLMLDQPREFAEALDAALMD